MYKIATGVLGWAPRDAWSALVPEILLAYEGKIDFIKATSPFGAAPAADKVQKADPRDMKAALRGVAASRSGA